MWVCAVGSAGMRFIQVMEAVAILDWDFVTRQEISNHPGYGRVEQRDRTSRLLAYVQFKSGSHHQNHGYPRPYTTNYESPKVRMSWNQGTGFTSQASTTSP